MHFSRSKISAQNLLLSVNFSGLQFAEENISSWHLDKHVQKCFSSYQTKKSLNAHVTSNPILATEWDVDCFSVKDGTERRWRSRDRTPFRDLVDGEEKGCEFDCEIMLRSFNKKNDISSCINSTVIVDDVFDTSEDLSIFPEKSDDFKHSSLVNPDTHSCQKHFSNWRLPGRDYEKAYESSELKFGHQALKQKCVSVERPRRCQSAPPFYKLKTSFYCLDQRKAEKTNATSFYCLDQRMAEKFNVTNFYSVDQEKAEMLKASDLLDSPSHLGIFI